MIKIREALPNIFERPHTVVEPSTKTQVAMCLLAFHEVDALPAGLTTGKRKYVISGIPTSQSYSRLVPQIMLDSWINPPKYFALLSQPFLLTGISLTQDI